MIWAKKYESEIHLLINHMLDVYNTSNAIIDSNIKIFSKLDSFSIDDKSIWAAIIGLHDIGKATPDFQCGNTASIRHEILSVYILFQYLKEKLEIDNQVLWQSPFFQTIKFIIMHHSKFDSITQRETIKSTHSATHSIGDISWKTIQFDIIDDYLNAIGVSVTDLQKVSFKNISDATYFSGLMTLADWVGSDTNNFKLEGNTYSLEEYIPISKARAQSSVKSTGLSVTPNITKESWLDLFPNINLPRNLQQQSINCDLASDSNLIIIEAPTGEGKTEAAFNLAARLSTFKSSGIYVAMPTQATSNGLFHRFEEFLKNADNTKSLNLKLIHGGTFLNNLKEQIGLNNINAPEEDTKSDAFNWFNKGKKAFLAPYGIGTIDQALYSILIVKHFFLRLYALTGKTIIFDEVHAYDTYMNKLLLHLIKWLKALKANVILLSATLPIETKNKILQVWDDDIECNKDNSYPVLDIIQNGSIQSYPFKARFETDGNLNFKIDFCDFGDDTIARLAEKHYKNGARVLVIVNKVKRAQIIFDSISTTDKTLFHSRFTSKDRERIEKDVLEKYGKESNSNPSILVSTQIVEQSLDIDFDIIISDLAPIDLLIQRAGRLHRHDRQRPNGYDNPKFIIATHEAEVNELPQITDGKIYAPIILYRTYFALKNNSANWNFHRDFREPVEEVYYPICQESERLLDAGLSKTAKTEIIKSIELFEQETLAAEIVASRVFIHPPEKFDSILNYSKIVHEEEENGKGIIAKTRLGSDTEKVILLFENNDSYYFNPDLTNEIDINLSTLDANTTYKLLLNMISLYSYQLAKYAENQPDWWNKIKKDNSMLKHYRVLIIDNDSSLKYNETTGLTN